MQGEVELKPEYTLTLFCALLVYWVYGLWLIFKRKKIKVGLIHLAIAALIFNGDEWYYDIRLAHYCHTVAGYKVYEQVSRKEGLVSNSFHPAPAFIEYFGNNQNEQGEWVSRLWRDVKNPNGHGLQIFAIEAYTANYEVITTKAVNGQLITYGEKIVRRSDQKLIAEYKSMASMGGWSSPLVLLDSRRVAADCVYEGKKTLSHDEYLRYVATNKSKFDKLISQTFTKE